MSSKSDASQLAKTSKGVATGYGADAADTGAQLTPFFQREMTAEHEFDPTQEGELLTSAEAPIGAVTGTEEAELQGNAARTHNATGLTKSLDEAARDRMKADATAGEGIASQDVLGAQQLRQEGAAGEMGLHGEDINAQLGAMGVENKAISQEDPGFLSDLNTGLQTLNKSAQTAMSGYQMSQG
jgi:hypothetical protein